MIYYLNNGDQIRKMQTASGGPFILPGKSLKEVDEVNNYNRNKAKGLFQGIMSGKILPTMSNIGAMLGAAYNGWLASETTSITGDVPNPGMRNPKLVVQTVQKARSIALRASKISDKIFDRQYLKAINSRDSKRVQAVRNLHFKGKTPDNKTPNKVYHGTDYEWNLYDESKFGLTDQGYYGKGLYSSEDMDIAKVYGKKLKELYYYLKNPYRVKIYPELSEEAVNRNIAVSGWFNKGQKDENYLSDMVTRLLALKELGNSDGVIVTTGENEPIMELVTVGNKVKSSHPITYDNYGNIIPISQRDNFLINDIRYKQGGKMNMLELLKNGGIFKFQNGTPKNGFIINKELPEIPVVPNRLYLYTYYPIASSLFPLTGHSELHALAATDLEYDLKNDKIYQGDMKYAHINKQMDDVGYNFITNNCADATRCGLEAITGKNMNPYFFTTPGDVLDFFKENFDIRKDVKRSSFGKDAYYTNISMKDFEKIKLLQDAQRFANALKRRKQHIQRLALNRKNGK